MKYKELLEANEKSGLKNKVKIKLLKDLSPLEVKVSHLRNARKKDDEETINHTVLGQLKIPTHTI